MSLLIIERNHHLSGAEVMQRSLNARLEHLEKEAGNPRGTPICLFDDGSEQSRERIAQAERDNPSRQVMVFRWRTGGEANP
jgi:hypothetical protein